MKVHCIAYSIKWLIFCELLLFFQNEAKTADSCDKEFTVISLFVYDNSLYCFIVR